MVFGPTLRRARSTDARHWSGASETNVGARREEKSGKQGADYFLLQQRLPGAVHVARPIPALPDLQLHDLPEFLGERSQKRAIAVRAHKQLGGSPSRARDYRRGGVGGITCEASHVSGCRWGDARGIGLHWAGG